MRRDGGGFWNVHDGARVGESEDPAHKQDYQHNRSDQAEQQAAGQHHDVCEGIAVLRGCPFSCDRRWPGDLGKSVGRPRLEPDRSLLWTVDHDPGGRLEHLGDEEFRQRWGYPECAVRSYRLEFAPRPAGVTIHYALIRETAAVGSGSESYLADAVVIPEGGVTIHLGWDSSLTGPALPDTALAAPELAGRDRCVGIVAARSRADSHQSNSRRHEACRYRQSTIVVRRFRGRLLHGAVDERRHLSSRDPQ